jgi:flagellar hook-associated protein 3 FlgL
MRVTDSMRADFWQNSIGNSLNNLNTVQQEIATGHKLNQPSDDPAGAAQAMAIGTSLVENNQYQRNVTAANAMLTTTSGVLSSVSNVLLSARQIASQGANTTDSSNYQALAQQVDALTTQLVGVANTKSGDKYVFSGTKTLTPPYTQYPTPSTTATAADNNTTPGNFAAGTYYVSYSYTYPNGGVSPASTSSTVTVATTNDSIDLSGVPALPSGATGVNVYVGTTANNMTLAQNFASNSPITVTTAPVGGAAAAPGPSPIYAGDSGAINATVGPNSTVQTNTPGNSIFDPVFQTLADLKANLLNAAANPPVTGAIDAISADITKVDANSQTVATTNTLVGAKVDSLKSTSQQLQSEATQYQQSLSDIQDVDLATAYVQLQSNQNVYQASLAATAKAFQFSLVNYLQ